MEQSQTIDRNLDHRMAVRLKALRGEGGWSLDALAQRSGVSRATLSRLENGQVSPTASVLGRLCSVYGITMSRLMAMIETGFAPLVQQDEQAVWQDPETGFTRKSVSPPADTLNAEVLECMLPAGARIDYPEPPVPGLEHHLYLLAGALKMTVDDHVHTLHKGDCLRYQLYGRSIFETLKDHTAKYILVIV